MSTDYSVIESKISQFIKKYYLNNLIRGIVWSSLLFLFLSMFILAIEYFSFLTVINKIFILIFYFFIQFSVAIILIVFPLLGYVGVRVKISKRQINKIIVLHFPDIKDKLWNLIELKEELVHDVSQELLIASIEQRIDNLKHFKFVEAINIKQNLKAVYILIMAFVFSIGLILFSPTFIKEAGFRLIHFTQNFIKPSPFNYLILNKEITTGKGDDFTLRIKVESLTDYNGVMLHFGGNAYLMKQDSSNYFSYQFKNINNSINFNFQIDEYISTAYKLNVLPKPMLSSFSVKIIKPAYTSLKNDTYENITELIVPVGSLCEFTFKTFETDTILIRNSRNETARFVPKQGWKNRIAKDETLTLSLRNEYFEIADFLKIKLTTIADDYPSIAVNQILDSTEFSRIYFKGRIEDDYGFSNLFFVTKVNNEIDSMYKVQFSTNLLEQDFFYAFNFNKYKGQTDHIQYYFEIFDNDGVNGVKSSISELYSFNFPDVKDIFDYQDEQFKNIEDVLSNSMDITKELKKDLQNLQEKMINADLSNWERKELVKNIFSKKKNLEEAIKNIQEKNEEMNKYMDSFTEQNQELIDKQKEIQDMLDEVMSDDLNKLLDEFNKMMDNFNENKMNDLTEQMDISLDDLSKQLDKNLEMLKRMKIEKQLDLLMKDLETHINKQQELSELIDKGEKPENLLEKQSKEKEDVNKLKDQYNSIEKINKELEDPLNLYDFENEFKEIDQEFQNSMEQQEKNNKKKSQQSMDKNKANMESLAFMMQQMKDAAFAEQNSENLAELLQILDNTITFSFNQEKLIVSNSNNDFTAQFFVDQKQLYQDFEIIKDSLYALAKREPSVNMAVNKEIVTIQQSFRKIDQDLTESRISQAKINQQIVLTSANNLALFLSEVIKNLQQQMANSMPGNQNCEKPGNNPNPNSSSNSMKSMQQGLQQQLEKMMQMMKNGENGQGMNGEMGKALSQQEKMQNMLQKMMNQGNVGSDAYETLKQAEQLLNKVREDIIRNNVSNQTVNRQKEILTRLLEAENAENERELDDKRKSNTAEEQRISETAKYFDTNLSNDNFKEKLIKQKLVLKKYYQGKYQHYINQLDSLNGSDY
ncbi:MAG: hypothetical protein ACERKD_16755 [Prolixibacteraceae bacterium]